MSTYHKITEKIKSDDHNEDWKRYFHRLSGCVDIFGKVGKPQNFPKQKALCADEKSCFLIFLWKVSFGKITAE